MEDMDYTISFALHFIVVLDYTRFSLYLMEPRPQLVHQTWGGSLHGRTTM